jgi:hypothetical protein
MTLMVKLQESVFLLSCDELVQVFQTEKTATSLLRRGGLAAMLKLKSPSGSL